MTENQAETATPMMGRSVSWPGSPCGRTPLARSRATSRCVMAARTAWRAYSTTARAMASASPRARHEASMPQVVQEARAVRLQYPLVLQESPRPARRFRAAISRSVTSFCQETVMCCWAWYSSLGLPFA